MTKTLARTREGPDSVMHALSTSVVDERRTVVPKVIACRDIRRKLYPNPYNFLSPLCFRGVEISPR
jgi:hypothetical protein